MSLCGETHAACLNMFDLVESVRHFGVDRWQRHSGGTVNLIEIGLLPRDSFK